METAPNISCKNGWGIFYTGAQNSVHNIYELQKVDDEANFHSDDEAIEFVVATAERDNNSEEAKAVVWLSKYSKNEVDSIFRSVVGSDRLNSLLSSLGIKL